MAPIFWVQDRSLRDVVLIDRLLNRSEGDLEEPSKSDELRVHISSLISSLNAIVPVR